ncbi:MAG: homoserine kinase, partial [Holdemanella sp.]|nr:homoserine kinase [Holdemanella sp.]
IPPYPIKTEEARKLLPKTISYKKACKQVAHALTFIQALYVGNEVVLTSACKDYLHEPYRKKLIKEYDSIHDYCIQRGFPMWISGSGSTMLALSLKKENIDNLMDFIQMNYPHIECRTIAVSKKGAYVEYE